MKRLLLVTLTALLWQGFALGQDSRAMRDSLARLSRMLESHPDSIDLRLKKAACNVELEQWEYALDEYTRVLNRQPDNLAALFFRAYVNGQMSRLAFARQDYEQLLVLVPTHFEARLGLALVNQRDHRYADASAQIDQLIEQYPDSAVAWAVRAGMEAERGLAELAVYDYGEALKLDKENVDYIVLRAQQLIALGRRHEGYAELDRAVKLGVPKAALKEYYK